MSASASTPQTPAEATLAAVWPELAPELIARARRKFLTSPWKHEAQERAEERVQDAFVKCLRAAREGRWDGAKPKQFAGVVANNLVLDTLRQHRFVAEKPPGDAAGPEAAGDRLVAAPPEAEAPAPADPEAALAFELLPKPLRWALWLREWRGYSYSAAAEHLGIGLAAYKSRLQDARAELRELAREVRLHGAGHRRPLLDRIWYGLGGPKGAAERGACWPWLGGFARGDGPGGRAQVSWNRVGRKYAGRQGASVLRLLHAALVGPVPPWVRLGAPCADWRCVNPWHARRTAIVGRRRVDGRLANIAPVTAADLAADRPVSPHPAARCEADGDPDARTPSRFRARRRRATIAQRAVAAEAGLHVGTVSKYEHSAAMTAPAVRDRLWAALLRLDTAPAPLADGATARARRLALGVSARRLAEEAGVARLTLWRFESGQRADARAVTPTRRRLTEALDRLERERADGSAA